VQLHVTISVGFELEQQTSPSPNMFGRGNKLLVILEPDTMESLQIRSNGIKFRDKKESSSLKRDKLSAARSTQI
jgi:hypothetical protein